MLVGHGFSAGDGGGDGAGLARDRLDEAADLTVHADAVAQRVDVRIAGAQRGGVHRDAALPGQAGAARQARRRLQARTDDDLVGFDLLAAGGIDAVAALRIAHNGVHRGAAQKADRQALPRRQQRAAGLLLGPARQRRGLHVQQGDAVTAQRQVVGQFAADQAGADDEHVLRGIAQRRAQLLVGAQVVDAPAQRCRQAGRQGRLRAVRQDEFAVAQRAARGAQLALRAVDVDGVRVGQQAHAQAARGVGAALLDQRLGGQAARHRHRQQGLVVHVAGAGAHQGDRQLRVERAQRLGHLPAGAAGADDEHAGRAAPAGHPLAGSGFGARAQGLQAGRLVGREVGLGDAAQRAGPVLGDVLEARAGRQAAVGVALGFVVDPATGVADELPVRCQRLHGGRDRCGARRKRGCAHAGISSADRRAISLRRCLMAGVTMATKCDSRTRRCTSELSR